MIRNPWAWHVSWYNYIRKEKGGRRSGMPQEHELLQRMTFLNYLQWLDTPLITGKRNQNYLMQVSDWIVDDDGTVCIDDILRQETLRSDLQSLQARHNIRIEIPNGLRNESFQGDFRTEYTDEGAEIVARRHARDIAIFWYSFDSGLARGTALDMSLNKVAQ